MEISEYLREARGRRWLLLILPLVAALVAAGIVMNQDAQWQASATVRLPLAAATGSASAADQVVADYQSLLNTDAVLSDAAKATHICSGTIGDGLTSAQTQLGARYVTVTYTSPKKASAVPVAREAAQAALAMNVKPTIEAANKAVTEARSANDEATKAVNDYRTKTGVSLPSEEYRAASTELVNLLVALAQATNVTTPEPARVAGLTAQVDATRLRVQQLANFSLAFDAFTKTQASTSDALDAATRRRDEAVSQREQAFSGAAFTVTKATEASPLADIGRAAGAAAAGGIVLAMLLLVLLEMIRPVQRRRKNAPATLLTSAAPMPTNLTPIVHENG